MSIFNEALQTHMCLIIDKNTGKEIKEYQIKARFSYIAEGIAEDKFIELMKYQPNMRKYDNWYVDSCLL